jgi:hypothetical protein
LEFFLAVLDSIELELSKKDIVAKSFAEAVYFK